MDLLCKQLNRLHNCNLSYWSTFHDFRSLHVQSYTCYFRLGHIFHYFALNLTDCCLYSRNTWISSLYCYGDYNYLQFFCWLCNGIFSQSWTLLYGDVDRSYHQLDSEQCGSLSHLFNTWEFASLYCTSCFMCWIWNFDCLCEEKIHYFCNL